MLLNALLNMTPMATVLVCNNSICSSFSNIPVVSKHNYSLKIKKGDSGMQ